MPKISKKPCDFIVEETPPLKFVIIPPPFLPLWRGTWGRVSFALFAVGCTVTIKEYARERNYSLSFTTRPQRD